jgi:hypothetical protein
MYEGQLMQLQQQTWNMEQASMTTENLKNTVSCTSVHVQTYLADVLDGDCRRYACSKQGDEEAVQRNRH